jgi:hypothetical protein
MFVVAAPPKQHLCQTWLLEEQLITGMLWNLWNKQNIKHFSLLEIDMTFLVALQLLVSLLFSTVTI